MVRRRACAVSNHEARISRAYVVRRISASVIRHPACSMSTDDVADYASANPPYLNALNIDQTVTTLIGSMAGETATGGATLG
jgi:hypothetical protein